MNKKFKNIDVYNNEFGEEELLQSDFDKDFRTYGKRNEEKGRR